MRAFTALVCLLGLAPLGCGANLYGHSRTYVQLDAEHAAIAGAEEYDPANAKRAPDHAAGRKVALFGVVVARANTIGNKASLTLSLRALEPRNLCESGDEDSCRVTVTEREFDRVHATIVFASSADATGPTSIGPGSLLRIVGTIEEGESRDGAQWVDAKYYRAWPHGYYVTTSSASLMRR